LIQLFGELHSTGIEIGSFLPPVVSLSFVLFFQLLQFKFLLFLSSSMVLR